MAKILVLHGTASGAEIERRAKKQLNSPRHGLMRKQSLISEGVALPAGVEAPFSGLLVGMCQQLRESEERMNLAADAAQMGTWIWDVRSNKTRLSEKCRELFGFSNGDITYEALLQRIHPEDRAAIDKALRRALAEKSSYHSECRLLLPDGTLRYVTATGRTDCAEAGEPAQLLGVCIDATERRRAEEAARDLSGRFITAQEDERRRIARDLHDDLSQRLALLSVEMELFGQQTTRGEQPQKRLEQLVAYVKEISSEVHKLSYALHPAKLDQLGLVAAARAFCRDSSLSSRVQVDFVHDNVPRDLAADVALCLYRVIQESIQNVVRHSGAKQARVELRMQPNRIHLVVVDSGKGFDVEHARKNGGLGLVSIEERARLVCGTVAFYSRPGEGTRIDLSVPLCDRQPRS